MSEAVIRVCFAGAFAILALAGAIILEATSTTSGGAPEWLVAIAGLAAGYAFGHAQANGILKNNRKNKQ